MKKFLRIFKKQCPICFGRMDLNEIVCLKCRAKLSEYNKRRRCAKCGREIEVNEDIVCGFCEKMKPQFDMAAAVYFYTGEFKEAMLEFKFRRAFHRAKTFAGLMSENFYKTGSTAELITAVPAARRQFAKRGYNPPLEIGYCMKRILKIPLLPSALVKIRNYPPQHEQKEEDRYKNVKNAFKVKKRFIEKIKGKEIILLDDILTTGATASECAKMLKNAGAASVYVLTFLQTKKEK
jgi:ComF family protein